MRQYTDNVVRINQILQAKGYTQKDLGERIKKKPSEIAAKQPLLVGKVPDMELVFQKLLIATSLYKRALLSRSKIEGILTFLNNYVLFEDPETNRIFDEQLDKITGKTSTMGIIEQLAEIKAEEARKDEREKTRQAEAWKFVENLLSNTEFSLEKISSLADVSVAFVEKVKESLGLR